MRVSWVCLFAALGLQGCVAAWGHTSKIEAADSGQIRIAYDPLLTNSVRIIAIANKNCAQYQKVAVARSQTVSRWGIARIYFACDTVQEAAREPRAHLRDLVITYDPPPPQSFRPDYNAMAAEVAKLPATPSATPVPGPVITEQPEPPPPAHCIGQIPVNANVAMPCP